MVLKNTKNFLDLNQEIMIKKSYPISEIGLSHLF